jgi:hypothetical protein
LKASFILSAILIFSGQWCNAQVIPSETTALPSDHQSDIAMNGTGWEGSTYVPVDSWIYPALDRLHALGYVDSAVLGLRPWTRLSIAHMLELSADHIETDNCA